MQSKSQSELTRVLSLEVSNEADVLLHPLKGSQLHGVVDHFHWVLQHLEKVNKHIQTIAYHLNNKIPLVSNDMNAFPAETCVTVNYIIYKHFN